MLGLLVCLLILFWLLRKVIGWLSTGGNNMRRVEGGWIVDPGGRDKPYFYEMRQMTMKMITHVRGLIQMILGVPFMVCNTSVQFFKPSSLPAKVMR